MSDPDFPISFRSAEDLRAHGKSFAAGLRGGETIALIGGLGAGKTLWSSGLLCGLGSDAAVTSPTFSLIHEYSDARLAVFHFDLYRLGSAKELLEIGWDEFLDRRGVVIVEWADRFPELMPPNTIWLEIEIPTPETRVLHRRSGGGEDSAG